MSKKQKIVFFGASAEDILTQLSKIQEYEQMPDWQVLVIATGYAAQKTCRQNSIPFKNTIKYLTLERHYRAFTECNYLHKEWYKHPIIQRTLNHKGIPLYEMMEYHMWQHFSALFLNIELYKGVFEAEKPDRIAVIRKPSLSPTGLNAHDYFILNSLAMAEGIDSETIIATELKWPNTLHTIISSKPTLKRALNICKAKVMDYFGLVLFGNFRIEARRDFYRIWNLCFQSLIARHNRQVFSQKRRKIAFFSLTCAESVAAYLKKDSDNGVIYLGHPGERHLVMSHIPILQLESFSSPEINQIVEQKRSEFTGILEKDEVVNYLKNKFCYNGLNYWEIAREKLKSAFKVDFPLTVRGIELMQAMIDDTGIDLLISSSDANPVIRSMTKSLQLEGKQGLVLLHGIDIFTPEASEFLGKYLVPPIADKIATWGEASRDWHLSQGIPPNKVEAASCADFDAFLSMSSHSKNAVRRYLRIPASSKVILYILAHGNRKTAIPYFGETRDEILQNLEDVASSIASISQLHLIARPHPGDSHPEEIKQIIQNEGKANIKYCDALLPLTYYLKAADIILTYSSSAAIQAMVFNKDVIIYNRSGRPESQSYIQGGTALRVSRNEDLVPTINEILGKNSLRTELAERKNKFVRHCAGPIDGEATKNISSLIVNMIEEKRTTPKVSTEILQ